MSPETVASPEWRRLPAESALQRSVCKVAIDEAHCIHEWLVYGCHIHHVNYNYHALSRGESFRKSFQEIGGLRAIIEAPFMALTASASPSVESKIISLYLLSPVTVSCNLDRPNIFFFSVSHIKSLNISLIIIFMT